jgi:hypothetical protein
MLSTFIAGESSAKAGKPLVDSAFVVSLQWNSKKTGHEPEMLNKLKERRLNYGSN